MISLYDSSVDLLEAAALWNRALGDHYPLTPDLLRNVTANPVRGQAGRHFVARADHQMIGFVATQINQVGSGPRTGAILGIVVDPAHQQRGVGSALMAAALADLREQGCVRVMSGGRYPRIFPGIPTDLPGVETFFEKHGWTLDQTDYDLARRLDDYATPQSIHDRIAAENVRLYAATPADAAEVLAFNDREFAGWAETYYYVASVGDVGDFLVARDPVKGVVGSLLMVGPGSNPARCDALWRTIVGENIGGLGEVGVAASERGRGLGVALVAIGSELLKARGVGHCNIGFTSLKDFYGKLGYGVWREYHLGWQDL